QPDVPGVFVLELTVSDGTSTSEPDTVLVTVLEHGTGLNAPVEHAMMQLYPNPSSGTVYLRTAGQEIRRIEILDLQGRSLGVIPHHAGVSGIYRLETKRFNVDAGLLILKVTGEDYTTYLPLLIQ
ncbi:MAG: T9SS type A sorting domain-containing protein, partial [Bacteroidales bacterium]